MILGPGVTSRKEAAGFARNNKRDGHKRQCTDGEAYAGEVGALARAASRFLNRPSSKVFAQTRLCANIRLLQRRPVCVFLNYILPSYLFIYFFNLCPTALHFLLLMHSSN